jgi:hypothetical protein
MQTSVRCVIKRLTALGVVSVMVTASWADTVKLRFSLLSHHGRIVRVTEKQVIFQSLDGQQHVWPRHHVTHLQFDAPPEPAITTVRQLAPPAAATPAPTPDTSLSTPAGLTPVSLAQFKGSDSKTVYTGLYQLEGRPTCWLVLPTALTQPTTLIFNVLNKWNPAQPAQRFTVTARFLDDHGHVLGQAPAVLIPTPQQLQEWFIYLQGMSGVAEVQPISWLLPAKTKTIEWIVPPQNTTHQLAGYISRINLMP